MRSDLGDHLGVLSCDIIVQAIVLDPHSGAVLNLVTRSLDPTGRGRARWVIRWKPALNAFDVAFEGRLTPSTTN